MLAAVFGCRKDEPSGVAVTAVSMNPSAKALVAGTSFRIVAAVLPDDATDRDLEWSSSNTSVASVAQDGTVSAVAPGQASIYAAASNGVKGVCSVTVTAATVAVSGVKLDRHEASVEVDKTVTLAATVTPDDATDKSVVWSCSREDIAVVVDGVVRGVKAGLAVVTATTVDGGFSASCDITVTPKPIPVTGVAMDKATAEVVAGSTTLLQAIIYPSNATNTEVKWSSGNETVATVAEGVVTGVAPGTAVITVTTVDGGFKASCTVTVKKPVDTVTAGATAENFDITGNYDWNQ